MDKTKYYILLCIVSIAVLIIVNIAVMTQKNHTTVTETQYKVVTMENYGSQRTINSLGTFRLTAYCGGKCCNGKWAGKTSTGVGRSDALVFRS